VLSTSFYGWAYGNVFFPTWQRVVRHRRIGDHLALLEGTQWLGSEELERLQLASLRVLLEHAGRRIPYWRELFARIGFDVRALKSRSDLQALPVLTREIIQERFDDMVDPELHATNIRKGTSGTTGVPLRFEYCNESEAWRTAVRLRGYGWAGYQLGRPTLYYWGTGAQIPTGLNAGKIGLDRALKREVYVDAARQDEASMQRAVRILARHKPRTIVAYTQALATLARWILERDERDWPDANVVCAAEALLPHDRDVISRAFGPNVFETYGSRETMLIAAECDAHDGLHLSEENLIVEVAGNGQPASPGESGEVIITDLHNFGMPFIRYSNGDVATMAASGPCRCGRWLRKLTHVDGRRLDTLRDGMGRPVPGMVFISLLQSERQMLRAYQVVQKKTGAVELKIVPGRDWDAARFEGIARRLAGYFHGVPFRVTPCDEIPASASGKRRPVVVEN